MWEWKNQEKGSEGEHNRVANHIGTLRGYFRDAGYSGNILDIDEEKRYFIDSQMFLSLLKR